MDPNLLISASAFLVSLLALYFSRRDWREAYRPIIIPRLETAFAGNQAIAYDIILENVGARPATKVRLLVCQQQLDACLAPNADADRLASLKRVFEEDSEIAVIGPAAQVRSAFGLTGRDSPTWQPGARLIITAQYSDAEGRKYRDEYPIAIKDSASFSGTRWIGAGPWRTTVTFWRRTRNSYGREYQSPMGSYTFGDADDAVKDAIAAFEKDHPGKGWAELADGYWVEERWKSENLL